MALVAYDNSDSSGIEDEDDEIAPVVVSTKNVGDTHQSGPTSSSNETQKVQGRSLFTLLPQPSNKKPVVIEEDDEFLHKKETVPNVVKPKAKITVPSLSDFKDVDNKPAAKPKCTNGKKSGLLSMLPQPKGAVTATTRSLIPHVLTKKPTTATKQKAPMPSPLKKPKTDKSLVTNCSDESDNDEEVQNDFFSIHKPAELPKDDVPLDIDKVPAKPIQMTNQKRPLASYFKQDSKTHVELRPDSIEECADSSSDANDASGYDGADEGTCGYTEATAEASGELVLDDEAIMKLCGSRGKRRREDIQLVDVDQQAVLAGAREMLMKGLMEDTAPRVSASKRTGHEPTGQQRRKHQITYLAHQAKANEAELQNQWANNRMSRRQTQSKYGF